MTKMTAEERAAEAICRRLAAGVSRLPDLRRAVGPSLREAFIGGCALAIERGWAIRLDAETLRLGNFRPGNVPRGGARGNLASLLDAELQKRGDVPGSPK